MATKQRISNDQSKQMIPFKDSTANNKLSLEAVPKFILTTVLACFMLQVFFHSNPVDAASLPDDFGQSGQMYWQNTNNEYEPALALETQYKIDINGPMAKVILTQKFYNQSSDWQEGTYVYPLPETSSVHYLAITTQDSKIVAQIQEKSVAKKIYTAAKNSGKKAALLEQQRENIFKQAVANIEPGETVTVELHLITAVEYNHPTFSLSLPTTITPRFNNAPVSSDTDLIDGNTEETVSASAINTMTVDIALNGSTSATEFSSSSHELEVFYDGNKYHITTTEDQVVMDRDFHLEWHLESGAPPKSFFYTEQVNNEHYGLLMLTPPTAASQTLAQDIIFIIDTSGSMGGASIQQAKQSLLLALDQLSANDRFNIIEFNDNYTTLFNNSVSATQENIASAQKFIDRLQAGGGTQMLPALMEALASPITNIEALRQIVFITDGSVGYEADLLALLNNQLGRARLFTVGIGSAPNGYFMRKAAQVGRGSYVFINNLQHVSDEMTQLFTKLDHAVLRDISVQWPHSAEAWPERVADLYQSDPIVIAVKFKRPIEPDEVISLQGNYSDGSLWQNSIQPKNLSNSSAAPNGIAKLWAKEKINAILDTRYSGTSEESIRSAVLPIALQHQLLSPFTSFVAVEEIPTRTNGEPLSTEKLALTPPAGNLNIYAPQTATPTLPLLIIGGLLLISGLLTKRRGKTA